MNNPGPCKPNCPSRRFDCHFAGNCEKWDAHMAKVAAEKAADAPRVRGMKDAYAVARAGYDRMKRWTHDRRRK
jgi:hypothetical protein